LHRVPRDAATSFEKGVIGMNYKIAAATLVLACAFGSAGCSHNAGDQQAGTPSAASAQPPYTSTGTAATTGAAGTARMAGAASTAGGMSTAGSAAAPSTSFDDLAGSKGYITQEDAGRDAWLSGHFSGCDSNNDGKLTRQEYAQCMQKNGNAAEGVPPASSTH
jgi:hypothetical protein